MSADSSAATCATISSIENDDISVTSSKFGGEGGVGLMFEGSMPCKLRSLTFSPSSSVAAAGGNAFAPKSGCVFVDLECVDEEPGAVQSGHYLWPAASALSQYLVDTYGKPDDDSNADFSSSVTRIVELGAGCGLPGLTSMQVFRSSVNFVVLTDNDPSILTRAKTNYESTMTKLRKIHPNSKKPDAEVWFEELSWGDEEATMQLKTMVVNRAEGKSDDDNEDDGFQLVLASDVIYSESVVRPLLTTASQLLSSSKTSKVILAQSFKYDDVVEGTIDDLCSELGLSRTVAYDHLDKDGGAKVQVFSRSG